MAKINTSSKGGNSKKTGSKAPTGAASPADVQGVDTLKEPPASNAGGSNHKSTVGQPSMNKNTGERGQKQPRDSIRDKMTRKHDLSTVKGIKQAVSDAYSVRVAANKVKRDALSKRRELQSEYKKLTRNAETAKRGLNTAIFKRDGTAAEIYETEYNKLQEERTENANKRRAESVRASRADKLAQKMEAQRKALKATKPQKPSSTQAKAPAQTPGKTPVAAPGKTPVASPDTKTPDTKGTSKSGFKLPDNPDVEEPFPEDEPKPMKDSITLEGGDKLINDAGSPDSDDDDTDYGDSDEEDIEDVGIGNDDQVEAAEIVYEKVVYTGKKGSEPDYSGVQEEAHIENITRTLIMCDERGILYRYNGVNRSIVDAIIQGADPKTVWQAVMDAFNYDSEYFPYKGIVEFD